MTNIARVKVRYAETDQMGVVYYGNYFIWMEIGRTELLKESGISYKEIEDQGFFLPVSKAYAKYVAPSYYDDDISVHSTLTVMKGARLRIDYKIFRSDENRDNKLVCSGFTEHAFQSSKTGRIVSVPDFFINKARVPINYTDYMTKI